MGHPIASDVHRGCGEGGGVVQLELDIFQLARLQRLARWNPRLYYRRHVRAVARAMGMLL